jgi:hypothetical protein
MSHSQLTRQVARLTGEPLRTVRRLGFSMVAATPDLHEPEDIELVLDCPFCRRPVPYPGPAGDGSAAMAECDPCDVYFDFDPAEVYALPQDDEAAGRAG